MALTIIFGMSPPWKPCQCESAVHVEGAHGDPRQAVGLAVAAHIQVLCGLPPRTASPGWTIAPVHWGAHGRSVTSGTSVSDGRPERARRRGSSGCHRRSPCRRREDLDRRAEVQDGQMDDHVAPERASMTSFRSVMSHFTTSSRRRRAARAMCHLSPLEKSSSTRTLPTQGEGGERRVSRIQLPVTTMCASVMRALVGHVAFHFHCEDVVEAFDGSSVRTWRVSRT